MRKNWVNRALLTVGAKHITRNRKLNNKLEKLICTIINAA